MEARKMRMFSRSFAAVVVLCVYVSATQTVRNNSSRYCLDGYRRKMPVYFELTTCAKCFDAVTHGTTGLIPTLYNGSVRLVTKDLSFIYEVDVFLNESTVCKDVLKNDVTKCTQWRLCCLEAQSCCDKQIKGSGIIAGYCPMVWDGVICLPSTPSGERIRGKCPTFLTTHDSVCYSDSMAHTACGVDGNWVKGYKESRFFTNLTSCLGPPSEEVIAGIEVLKTSILVNLIGYSLSSLAAFASILLFLVIRNLRRDASGKANVRIHTNLFVAIIFNGVANIVWDTAIYQPSLKSLQVGGTPYYQYDTIDCKVCHFATLYFRGVVYWCMFCEGLLLLRRLTSTLSVGRSETLIKYVAVGWGVPAVCGVVYVVVRVSGTNGTSATGNCWLSTDGFELIMHIPNVASLVVNFIILCYISRTVTRMSNPSESRLFVIKRTLRATFTLVPLLGIQLVFVIYRSQCWWPYEVIANLLVSTQGLVVSLIYCFFNREVRNEIRIKFQRYQRSRDRQTSRSSQSSVHSKSRGSSLSTRATHLDHTSRQSRDEHASFTHSESTKTMSSTENQCSTQDKVVCKTILNNDNNAQTILLHENGDVHTV